MRAPKCDLLRAVPNPLPDLKGTEAAVDEKRYMGMPKVMHPDLFNACLLASGLDCCVEPMLGQGKDAVILLDVIELLQSILHLLTQELWNLDRPDTVFGLGGLNDVPFSDPLIVLVDPERLSLKVKIRRCQRQQLSLADAAPVQHLESIVEDRPVHHDLCEFQILLLRPEKHLSALFFPNSSGSLRRIQAQLIVADCVIEDRRELRMDRFLIGRRDRLSFSG